MGRHVQFAASLRWSRGDARGRLRRAGVQGEAAGDVNGSCRHTAEPEPTGRMAHGTRGWGGHWTWRGQEEGVRERTRGKDRPARREVKPARQARKVQRGGGSTTRRPCGDTGRGRATRQQAGARGHPAHGADRAAVQLRLRHQEGPSVRWPEGAGTGRARGGVRGAAWQ